jgi:hypothetical protein
MKAELFNHRPNLPALKDEFKKAGIIQFNHSPHYN